MYDVEDICISAIWEGLNLILAPSQIYNSRCTYGYLIFFNMKLPVRNMTRIKFKINIHNLNVLFCKNIIVYIYQ